MRFFVPAAFALLSGYLCAQESLDLSYNYSSDNHCYSGDEQVGKHRVAFSSRVDNEEFSSHMYVSTSLNCDEGTTIASFGFERRWLLNNAWYNMLVVDIDSIDVTRAYINNELLQYETDSIKTAVGAVGFGRVFGSLSLETGINLIPENYLDTSKDQNSFYVATTYRTEEIFSGNLLIEGSITAPSTSRVRTSVLVRWSRSFDSSEEDTSANLVVSWRFEGGLNSLVSPFSPLPTETRLLFPESNRSIAFNIGLGWETQ